MSSNPDSPFSSSEDEVDLVFRDKDFKKHCVILQEFDGKGVFILPNEETPSEPVLGLTQIIHFIRRPALLRHPHTIRDIVRRYVKDVSIFEESTDKMNLITSVGVRINLGDPPSTLFQNDETVTLYLQNREYLSGREESTTSETQKVSYIDWLIITGCIAFLTVTPYVLFWLITEEKQVIATLKST